VSNPALGVLALELAKNAPPTVAVALILKDATEAEFVAIEGLLVPVGRVAAAKLH
jgi:hypothetical protein